MAWPVTTNVYLNCSRRFRSAGECRSVAAGNIRVFGVMQVGEIVMKHILVMVFSVVVLISLGGWAQTNP
jgi:hypothetical protein